MKSTIGGSVAGEATSLPTRPMVGALMVNLVMAMTIGSRFSGDRTSYGSFQASKRLRGLIHRSSALEHPGQSNAANAQVSSWHSRAIAAVDPRHGRNCRNYRPRFESEEAGSEQQRLIRSRLCCHAASPVERATYTEAGAGVVNAHVWRDGLHRPTKGGR
jgi:hypothetical protein